MQNYIKLILIKKKWRINESRKIKIVTLRKYWFGQIVISKIKFIRSKWKNKHKLINNKI